MIRRAKEEELDQIMKCIVDSRAFLKASGSSQWNGPLGYPHDYDLLNDIKMDRLFVNIRDNRVCGVCALSGCEKDYEKPYGSWQIETNNYLTIHRMAVNDEFRGKGVATELFEFSIKYGKENGYDSIRVDTHEKNVIIQHLALKLGFKACGYVIYSHIAIEPKRLIYEKVLKQI